MLGIDVFFQHCLNLFTSSYIPTPMGNSTLIADVRIWRSQSAFIFDIHMRHLYMIRIKKEYGITRDELFKKFLKFGIQTSLHYTPLHEFTVFKKLAKKYVSLKNSKMLYNELISLPMFPYISKKEQDNVIKCIISNK